MNLAELVTEPTPLRIIREREGAITEYRIILVRVLREIRAEVVRSVLPLFRAYRRELARDALVVDRVMPAFDWFESLRRVASAAVARAVVAAGRLFERELTAFTRRFRASVKQGLSVELPESVVAPDLERRVLLADAVAANAALIKSLSDDAVKRVEFAVIEARRNRASARRLSGILQREFGTVKSRADLIAVDQIASMHADFTRMHHQSVGIDHYRWITQRDERVRDRHRPLHGRVYRYGETTGAEGGVMPGRAIRCRCVAAPVVNPA